jgi:hypothetical protein
MPNVSGPKSGPLVMLTCGQQEGGSIKDIHTSHLLIVSSSRSTIMGTRVLRRRCTIPMEVHFRVLLPHNIKVYNHYAAIVQPINLRGTGSVCSPLY